MNQFEYIVEWDSNVPTLRYKQDFETLEEARIALALHNKRNAELQIKIKQK